MTVVRKTYLGHNKTFGILFCNNNNNDDDDVKETMSSNACSLIFFFFFTLVTKIYNCLGKDGFLIFPCNH